METFVQAQNAYKHALVDEGTQKYISLYNSFCNIA